LASLSESGFEAPAWQGVYEEARAAWPDVQLPFGRFLHHLQRRDVRGLQAARFPADLFLAFACLEGDERAVAAFERHVLLSVERVVARVKAGPAFVDEVIQDLRSKLLVGPPPGLAGYSGRGPLLAWVRVAASRAAIDAIRAAGAEPAREDLPADLAGHDLGPEARLLLEGQREAFQRALTEALSELTAQDRNLLRRHLVDEMTLEEIAAPYSVHPATIARRLTALREAIAEAVRARLRHLYDGLEEDQLESVFRAIRSQVHVSISPLLSGGEPGAANASKRA
jgi:RNA polymerase sigma-70 factor, ECF subfamily